MDEVQKRRLCLKTLDNGQSRKKIVKKLDAGQSPKKEDFVKKIRQWTKSKKIVLKNQMMGKVQKKKIVSVNFSRFVFCLVYT